MIQKQLPKIRKLLKNINEKVAPLTKLYGKRSLLLMRQFSSNQSHIRYLGSTVKLYNGSRNMKFASP